MAKRTTSGVSSPPKPPKLTLPKPSRRPAQPNPAKLEVMQRPPRPPQPKPAKLAAARPHPPKPPRLNFRKPHTSDSLTVIPMQWPHISPAKLRAPSRAAAPRKTDEPIRAAHAPVPVAKVPVKVVLWISSYPALLATTSLMLQAEGFDVHTASDFLQVQSACTEDRFQLAIVDHTLAPKIKRAIAAVIREKRAATLILELCQVSSEISDADYLLIGHDPDALVRMVKRIARERSRA